MDPIRLEVFKHLFTAAAEEMGAALRKSSYSPNIKERRDFSCAVFNPKGEIIAQAAHIPVHLGSMPLSVKAAIQKFEVLSPGDMILLNNPYQGGTHLPDLTLVSPIFTDAQYADGELLLGYVANRAHHADIGGMTPGSMPIATELFQEGLIIPPVKVIDAGDLNTGVFDLILANVRTSEEREGDLWAQIAANRIGIKRIQEYAHQYEISILFEAMDELISYTERIMRALISSIPDGEYSFTDFLDNNGINEDKIKIFVTITISGDTANVDFTGTDPQQFGSVNAVYPITLSAVYYVFRCLLEDSIPNNAGILRPLTIIAPKKSVVNAEYPAPVAGGNVETSQRIVDVLLGALSHAIPDLIPAASQGTMNNLTIGGIDNHGKAFTYYETIAGGMGARPGANGIDAIHTHMTNTLNTPIEALEFSYPLQVQKYEIVTGSGGAGKNYGGNGVRREIRMLVQGTATWLTERRLFSPYGLMGGNPGLPGKNLLIRGSKVVDIGGKGTRILYPGDVISIQTPGGGGFGSVEFIQNS